MKLIDGSTYVRTIAADGIVMETDTGALVRCSAADGNTRIYRSIDDGATWSLRQTMNMPVAGGNNVKGAFIDSRRHLYFGGMEQSCTYENYASGYFGQIWKSTDDGLTWTKVCTSETSAFWHFAEDSTGRVYVNEYSNVPTSGTEFPALNIWRSDTSGANFVKWHSATGESAPGLKDGVRHIHAVYVDSSDRVFALYGDDSWGGLAGHCVRLNAAGTVDLDYGKFDNGMTSAIEGVSGAILLGADRNPSGIDAIAPTAALSCRQCNFRAELPARMDAYVFDLLRGQDDVIWGQTTLSSRYPLMVFSLDDGANWHAMDLGEQQSTTITINRSAPHARIYLSGNPVRWIPAFSEAELRAMLRGAA